MKFLLSIFLLLTTLNSCNSSKKAIESSKKMQKPLSGTYYITQLAEKDVSANKMVITFDKITNKVTGFAGCNSFFGNYTEENNSIAFKGISYSKKLCPGEASVNERQFLKSLNSVNTFTTSENNISFLENDTILITGSNKTIASKKSLQNNNAIDYKTLIKYKTFSKMTFDFISISESNILLSKDKGLLDINKYPIEQKKWNTLYKLIKAIDVETIKDLVPPSTSHQLDGALAASLSIIMGDVEYTTPTFDHGNPPKAIETLVNKVLSLKENTLKK